MGPEVPLEVADPEHHLGDGGGARIHLDTEELVRVDDRALQFEQPLSLTEAGEGVEYFPFEPLEVFERDVEKVSRAAGRIEHLYRAEAAMKCPDLGDSALQIAFRREADGGGVHVAPLVPDRLDDGRQDQPLDVGAGGVMGTEGVALARVERAFQQRSENGRLDIFPVGFRRFDEQFELGFGDGQCFGLGEQAAVESQEFLPDDR
ncbi:MAG: hypothetical protein BWY66_01369 [bacterium ADurb.Bin374]|nr:MAG: hypothetical protein BWY66_01369 [bacterium ADurb.Bin374]